MVIENCSEVVKLLAIIGGIAIYLLIGCVIGAIVSELAKDKSKSDRETLVVFSIILWPIAIAAGIIYVGLVKNVQLQ